MRNSAKLALRTRTTIAQASKWKQVETRSVMQINMAEDIYKTRISSCFMHFDGVTEQLCKVTRQRLKKFLECRSKWAKLKCQQAEIAKKSYENIDDGTVNSYIEKNPDTINLEWNHHPAGRDFVMKRRSVDNREKKKEKELALKL